MSGFVGGALAIISLVFVFGLDYSEVFIFPVLAVEFADVVVKYGDGTSMPSVADWAAYLTIVGTVIFALGLSGLFPMTVVRVGSVIFGAALIALGSELQTKTS